MKSPPEMMSVTATKIRMMPQTRRNVSDSPKTSTPMTTAVTGSNAPRMAAGVEPMYWMESVMQPNDMTVGKMAKATRLPHRYHWSAGGVTMLWPKSSRNRNTSDPNSRP